MVQYSGIMGMCWWAGSCLVVVQVRQAVLGLAPAGPGPAGMCDTCAHRYLLTAKIVAASRNCKPGLGTREGTV